jgi:hypothetical protein
MQEIFSPVLTKPNVEFDLPKPLLDAVQHLRTVWGVPIEITSVIRPADPQGSLHKIGHAIDFITYENTLDYLEKWKTICVNYKTSSLFKELRALGLNGFGVENNNCIHIDFRPDSNCTLEDEFGKYCIFSWLANGTPMGISTLIT